MSSSKEVLFGWDLWVLELKKSQNDKSPQIELLYSWVVPVEADRPIGWLGKAQELIELQLENASGSPLRCKLLRGTYINSKNVIQDRVAGLLSGMTLGEVFTDFTEPIPSHLGKTIPKLRIVDPQEVVDKQYVQRPQVFLSPWRNIMPTEVAPLPAPIRQGCFVRAWTDLTKTQLTTWRGAKLNFTQSRSLWKGIAEAFKTSSGFDLRKESAKRIGNIEWFDWGHWHEENGSPLAFSSSYVRQLSLTRSEAIGATIELSKNVKVLVGTKLLVRCRLNCDKEVGLDQQNLLEWKGQDEKLQFIANQPISSIYFGIWAENEDGKFVIQFENENNTLLKAIQLNSGIMGNRYLLDKPALLSRGTDNRDKEAIEQLQQVDRIGHGMKSQIGDRKREPWIEAGNSKLGEMGELFPDRSEGRFFLRGWDERDKASGSLSFFKWMLSQMTNNGKNEIWLIDPFFDAAGVDVFARTETTEPRFRVLTNCQLATSCTQQALTIQSTSTTQSTEPLRANRIREACNRRQLLLEGVDLVIEDLRSNNGGNSQLFHDRYLLICNERKEVVKGFHLSNSIQGATKSHPLLITPIPSDLLHDVAQYVVDLKEGKTKEASIHQLYPLVLESESDLSNEKPTTTNWFELPNIDCLLGILYDIPKLSGLSEVETQQLLSSEGVYNTRRGIHFRMPNSTGIKALAAKLAEGGEDFQALWESLGHLKARAHFYYNLDDETEHPQSFSKELCFELRHYTEVLSQLKAFLLNMCGSDSFYKEINRRALSLTILKTDSWNDIISQVSQALAHWGGSVDSGYRHYPAQLAARVLAGSKPELAVSALEELIDKAEKDGWNQVEPDVQQIINLGGEILTQILHPWNSNSMQIAESLLKSSYSQLRAAGVALAFYDNHVIHKPNTVFPNPLPVLKTAGLSNTEFRLALAHGIKKLHFDLNQKRANPIQKHQLNATLDALRKDWQQDVELVPKVVRAMVGRFFPQNSAFVTKKFLKPLLDEGNLNAKAAFDIWHHAFQEKIAYKAGKPRSGVEASQFEPRDSDGELSATIWYWFQLLPVKEQLKCIKDWKDLLYLGRSNLRQPLAHLTNGLKWQDFAIRFAWLLQVLNSISLTDIDQQPKDAIKNLLNEMEPDCERCRKLMAEYHQPLLKILRLQHQAFCQMLVCDT